MKHLFICRRQAPFEAAVVLAVPTQNGRFPVKPGVQTGRKMHVALFVRSLFVKGESHVPKANCSDQFRRGRTWAVKPCGAGQ
ncbi:MAG: hypothetical protein AB7E65_11565, partial [Syntrophotalea sp.]|uniref:hypothetical protein n=1 Tax=Syntrophotalea sp. TaxID=2812029 RepID=UPI003D117DBC